MITDQFNQLQVMEKDIASLIKATGPLREMNAIVNRTNSVTKSLQDSHCAFEYRMRQIGEF